MKIPLHGTSALRERIRQRRLLALATRCRCNTLLLPARFMQYRGACPICGLVVNFPLRLKKSLR